MTYAVIADIVILAHLLWILFLVFGGFWGRRHGAVRFLHLVGLAFAFIINVIGFYCPLTYLEVWLHSKGSPGEVYIGSFISHYLEKIIYIEVPEYVITLLTVALCAFNAWVYLGKRRLS